MQNRTENQVELHLIRHGFTLSNEEHRYLGRTEEPLSEKGIRQLQEKRIERLREKSQDFEDVDLFLSGPMLRCRQTAEILFPEYSPEIVEEWREMDFGSFEGKNYQELSGNADYQKWIESGGTLPFPEGESREVFIERSMQGLWKALEYAKEEAEKKKKTEIKAVAVVHGGTVMAIMNRLTGEDYFDFQIKNGESLCLVFQGQRLLSWNMDRS